MAGNLRARLSRIRGNAGNTFEKAKDSGLVHQKQRDVFPEGWTILQAGLRCRNTCSRIDHRDSATRLCLNLFSGRIGSLDVALRDIVFFDLETTGLSGGSGTVAFLAAFGRYEDDGTISVRQYFIDDYPSEPDFLQCLEEEFARAGTVVTYNGSTFDMPLYSVRRTMNGLGPPAAVIHVDALHAARRLWHRTIGDCSLGKLEAEFLGVVREDDIPGSEVPDVWFDYLKHGSTERLARVFSHNELDVRSLATLFLLIHDAVTGASACRSDPVGLAVLQARIDEGMAEKTLCAALNSGDVRATRPLMKIYARQGRPDYRLALIPKLPDDPAGLFSKSVYAERILGNLEESLRLVYRASVMAKGILREKALRREQRLAQKLAGLQDH